MSRTGKKPIPIPDKVTVVVQDETVAVRGPGGSLQRRVHPLVAVAVDGKIVHVKRSDESRLARSVHGLTRTLVANMVQGVTEGFRRELDIIGVGYRAELKGKDLQLALGYSHPVLFPIPDGITIHVDKQTHVVVSGADKELVGETAARIRRLRLPEPYNGKGVRYADEVIKRKVGKAAAGATGVAK
ncbi:MAG: 50S ribosomal protein L6 [Deltaproteobacteria bacterium]|nr:50S ribosomal protein L6 [Deltaproteobacteria bacterium]